MGPLTCTQKRGSCVYMLFHWHGKGFSFQAVKLRMTCRYCKLCLYIYTCTLCLNRYIYICMHMVSKCMKRSERTLTLSFLSSYLRNPENILTDMGFRILVKTCIQKPFATSSHRLRQTLIHSRHAARHGYTWKEHPKWS